MSLIVLTNADLCSRIWSYQNGAPFIVRVFVSKWKKMQLPNTVSDYVCKIGDLPMLQRLLNCGYDLLTPKAMDWAAMQGHLHIVQYLHENHNSCTVDAIDQAAKNGHFELVAFLCNNRKEGCTSNGYLWAATHGYVHIVRLLSFHYPHQQWNYALAIERAAAQGHLDMVKWLLPLQSPLTIESILKIAVYHGHVSILELLLQSSVLPAKLDNTMKTMARYRGHTKVLNILEHCHTKLVV
ncbi:hypothetical protein THRCLA_22248 [Thraustotheca clavata]|uniref:Uncharacterized protein n=1 Tax=Thraustotheca clavata TaxID=74557 RepID=A0A1V9Z8E6_9STRA|nr:hypothetical protein THRCLA_22248 [Thraustotheca clavata]